MPEEADISTACIPFNDVLVLVPETNTLYPRYLTVTVSPLFRCLRAAPAPKSRKRLPKAHASQNHDANGTINSSKLHLKSSERTEEHLSLAKLNSWQGSCRLRHADLRGLQMPGNKHLAVPFRSERVACQVQAASLCCSIYRPKKTVNTYDHRSVKTGHPVRNHEVSIVFVVPETKILKKEGVVIAGTWIHVTCELHDQVKDLWILELDLGNLGFDFYVTESIPSGITKY
jgi:hypothetical protein